MRIGLTGAHRTGKSTLAKALAEQLGVPFVTSSAGAIAKKWGFDLDKDSRMDPHAIEMQHDILDDQRLSFHEHADFVSDRTPLDAAAYLFADIQAGSGDAVLQEQALIYRDQALRITERSFDVVILVPPAISFEPVDGKPGANLAYQEHHHLLCRGLQAELTGVITGYIERDNLDLNDRIEACITFIRAATFLKVLRAA
jgi:nicotinamide riboside kinase